MSIPGAASPLFLATTAGAAGDFSIARSLRFNSADSAYLNRTPSSASNRKTWTWSNWIKRSALSGSTRDWIFIGGNTASDTGIIFIGFKFGDDLLIGTNNTDLLLTNAVFRDLSAWMHIVVAFDTTQSTASNRLKVYVNGVEITSFSTDNRSSISQNGDYGVNQAQRHTIGSVQTYAGNTPDYIDAYLAECILVDGSALDPTSFGAFDDNGVWQAIDTAGLSFGTNGFRLQFADNSGSTATTIGKDTSGNSNNFTPNNFSVLNGNGNYTSTITYSGTQHGDASRIFDGNTANASGIQNGTMTYTPSPSTSVSSTIKFWYSTDQSNTRFKVNSGSYITLPDPSGVGIYTHSFSGTLSSIEWNAPSNGELLSVHQIQIDNLILLNYSVGPENDSLVDTPTNGDPADDTGSGGQVTGNHSTLSPLRKHADSGAAGHTLANGNLDITATAGACGVGGTIGMSGGGKYYWEVTYKTGTEFFAGIIDAASETKFLNAYTGWSHYGHLWGPKNSVFFDWTGGGAASTSISSAVSNGDIMGMALDLDNNSFQYYKNGAAVGSARSVTAGKTWTIWIASGNNTYNNLTCSVNFGQRAFAHTAPSNHKALNTANLPTPTIADGSKYFDTKLWTGDGASTRTISGYGFSPDFIWAKNRSLTGWQHTLYDQIRGAGTSSVVRSLATDQTRGESSGNDTNHGYLSGFTSDGFDLVKGSQGGGDYFNHNGNAYVGWGWDGGTSTVTNNDGSIASQVRAQPSAGFSICTYTGNGTGGASIGHGLNAAVEFLIVKDRSAAASWHCQHSAIGNTSAIFLNSSAAAVSNGAYWNNTSPTSSVFTVGTADGMNGNGNTYVAYCFAPVEGFSSMGSWTGTGSADGPFIALSFRPAFVLWKRTNGAAHWSIVDSSRSPFNVADDQLAPNLADAESSNNAAFALDLCSNGIKVRATHEATNLSGSTYIYYAVAENPFQANGGLAR